MIFVLQSGGLGDLVLTSQLIAALKRSYPGERIVLGLDSSLQGFPAVFPIPPDEVCPLNLRALASLAPTPDLYGALRAICARLSEYQVRTFIDATYRGRWLNLFLAAALRPERAIGCADALHVPAFRAALTACDLSEPALSTPKAPRQLSEPGRYRFLAEFVCGAQWPEVKWTISAEGETAALDWLRAAGFEPERYVLCFPLGASVPMKRWPIDRFVEVLDSVCAEEGLSVVFAGSPAEAHEMGLASAKLRVPSKVHFGKGFQALAALVSHARVFLGTDSGLAHLAQAVGTNGVIAFGGGTWPAYRPWAPGVTGIVHSLPCFECNWDCLFEHAFCVDRVSVPAVSRELRAVLHSPPATSQVIDTSIPDEPRDDMIRRAAKRYGALSRKYEEIGTELQRVQAAAGTRALALEEMSRELAGVRAEAGSRAVALEEMSRELAGVRAEAGSRAVALEEMSRELAGVRAEAGSRSLALEEMSQELTSVRAEAERRALALEGMSRELAGVRAEAESRSLALEEMSQELTSVRGEAERRALALEEMSQELTSVRGEAERRAVALEAMRGELVSVYEEAERRANALEAANREIARLRDEPPNEPNTSLPN